MSPRALLLFLFLTAFPLVAEEPAPAGGANGDKLPARSVRILPVGEMPPFRQEIRDGVRYELEPPPGSIPPREIFLRFGEGDDGSPVTLQLGRISAAAPLPGGAGSLTLGRIGLASPWLSLQRPEEGDVLVILWRDPASKTWDRARGLVVPDGTAAAPPGSVHLLNLSETPVAVVLDSEKIALPAHRSIQRRFEPGKDRSLQVGLPDGKGGLRRFHASSLAVNHGERTWILVFRADGVAPRNPVKVSVLREPVGTAQGSSP